MSNIQVAVINASTVVKDAEVEKVVAALQTQVTRDWYPAWGMDVQLVPIPKGADNPLSADAWQLVVLDNSDMAEALGYHDVTRTGRPIGKVFAKTDLDVGLQWSVTASHELLEMLGDPYINLTVFREDIGQLWAYEVCDACESDSDGYAIDGVQVSDFVFPSWFEGFWKPEETQFDFCKRIIAPFQLLTGGYIGYFDIATGLGWQQQLAQGSHQYRERPRVGSRRERRRIPKKQWMLSAQ